MKLVYMDDSAKFKEALEHAVELIWTEEGIRLEFDYLEPDGREDDFIFFNEQGKAISDLDEMESATSPMLCYKKSTIDDLIFEKSVFFVIDINFAPGDDVNLIELAKYGLWLSRYLFTEGVPKENIVLLTRYPKEARDAFGKEKVLSWFDQIDKADLNKTVHENAETLLTRLIRPVKIASVKQPNQYLPASKLAEIGVLARSIDKPVIGNDPKFLKQLVYAKRVAPFEDVEIIITGETGTGKEGLAYFIHKFSDRADKPFIAINCSAITESLITSEFFGYMKGAFTSAYEDHAGYFEQAHTGTLFLDEIAELSTSAQAQILRVLDNKKITRIGGKTAIGVDVRIIVATNKDISPRKNAEGFRPDLFFRLEGLELDLCPLRDRIGDIPLLCEHFLNDWRAKGGQKKKVSDDLMLLFQRYHWPGNIRELKNIIDRLFIMTDGNVFTVEDANEHVKELTAFIVSERVSDIKSKPKRASSLFYKNKIVGKKTTFFPQFKIWVINAYDDEEAKLVVTNFLMALLTEAVINPNSFKADHYKQVAIGFIQSLSLENDIEIVNRLLNLDTPIDVRSIDYKKLIKNPGETQFYSSSLDSHRAICKRLISEYLKQHEHHRQAQ